MAYTAIDSPGANFNTVTYTGSGTAQSITGVGFQTDFGFIRKNAGANSYIYGPTTGKSGSDYYYIAASDAAAQTTSSAAVASIDSDGFTFQSGSPLDNVNTGSAAYTSWNWKGGTTTGIDTTGSTITPSAYSFNQAAGFSALKYTGNNTSGALLAHGLGAVPEMVWIKNLDSAQDWSMYHKSMDSTPASYGSPEDYKIQLNGTPARVNTATYWNDTAPTSVNMCLGNAANVNNTEEFAAYFFTGIQGYSKFGYYEGNADTDGIFVYTGFRPAYVFAVSIDSTSDRVVFDNRRAGFNPDNDQIVISNTDVQTTSLYCNINSNGFHWKTAADPNVAETFIYAAFAESPFVNSEAVPTNAR
tara:strand:+ start:2835 stop:3908 length:1074 start_codon:yes stop_codon:yes gene_type:complete